jgi:MtN3 and saliva related transmembrane protein
VSTSDILAVGATIAGLAMALSPVLQIRRMRRTRSSNDVSLLYLGLLSMGFVVWIAYGYAIGNWVLVGTNSASFTFMVITITVALRYRRSGARRAAAALAAESVARTAAGEAKAAGGVTGSAPVDGTAPGEQAG